MVSQENTMNVGNDAAGYIPVEADFKFKHTDGELALDDNFAAQSFWKDVLILLFQKNQCSDRSDPDHYHYGICNYWPGDE